MDKLNEIEIVDILKEMFEQGVPISLKSLINTLMLDKRVATVTIPDDLPSKSDPYKVALQTRDIYRNHLANVWIYIIGEDEVYVYQYFNILTNSDRLNVNRNYCVQWAAIRRICEVKEAGEDIDMMSIIKKVIGDPRKAKTENP